MFLGNNENWRTLAQIPIHEIESKSITKTLIQFVGQQTSIVSFDCKKLYDDFVSGFGSYLVRTPQTMQLNAFPFSLREELSAVENASKKLIKSSTKVRNCTIKYNAGKFYPEIFPQPRENYLGLPQLKRIARFELLIGVLFLLVLGLVLFVPAFVNKAE